VTPFLLASWIAITATILSILGVGWTRRIALRQQMIDIPNERSSHTTPTPRGGGLSIVVIVVIGTLLLSAVGTLDWRTASAVLVGTGVAAVGYLDDRGGLSPLVRVVVHLLCAVTALILIGGMPPLNLGFTVVEWGIVGHIIGVIGIIWMINLYNFMDGIDGLAGSEAVFVIGMTSVLMLARGITGLSFIGALVVGACLGFLRWNWPRAKIFMGDVGSGFLGYMIAVMAIMSGHAGFSLWIWLILIAVFFVDATITVVRRAARGEKWYHPHRSHAYQHLTMHWGSHLRVTLSILGIDLLWLAPLALTVYLLSELSLVATGLALTPLAVLALRLGAGQNRSPMVQHPSDRTVEAQDSFV